MEGRRRVEKFDIRMNTFCITWNICSVNIFVYLCHIVSEKRQTTIAKVQRHANAVIVSPFKRDLNSRRYACCLLISFFTFATHYSFRSPKTRIELLLSAFSAKSERKFKQTCKVHYEGL